MIQRVVGSARGCTHLRGREGGCLPERCHLLQVGGTPLHLAAQMGKAAVVEPLLAAGAAVDAETEVRGVEGGRCGLGGRTLLCVSSLFFSRVEGRWFGMFCRKTTMSRVEGRWTSRGHLPESGFINLFR